MTTTRAIRDIASEINADWANVNYAAIPYLKAMFTLNTVTDYYFEDSGKTVVNYFLSNAGTWHGPVAKRIKAELKAMVKR